MKNNKFNKKYGLIAKVDEDICFEEAVTWLKKSLLEFLNSLPNEEMRESKRVFFDKQASQFSIKIPKSLALKSGLDENSTFDLILKTKNKETLGEINESGFVIFLKK